MRAERGGGRGGPVSCGQNMHVVPFRFGAEVAGSEERRSDREVSVYVCGGGGIQRALGWGRERFEVN